VVGNLPEWRASRKWYTVGDFKSSLIPHGFARPWELAQQGETGKKIEKKHPTLARKPAQKKKR